MMSDCDSVYAERDRLVCYLSKQWPSVLAPVDDAEPGWSMAVYVFTPEGQLSWHIPDHELSMFEGHCIVNDISPWDGHSTDEKYERLARL